MLPERSFIKMQKLLSQRIFSLFEDCSQLHRERVIVQVLMFTILQQMQSVSDHIS